MTELKKGYWILVDYGWDRLEFYVLDTAGDEILIGRKGWLVSSAEWESIELLQSKRRNMKVIRVGKLRWWWRIIPSFFSDLYCPFTRGEPYNESKTIN